MAYALCYIFSPFIGLQITFFSFYTTAAILIGIGFGLLACVYKPNKYLILFFAVVEAFGCAGHYVKIFPWMPTFTDTGYISMSLLDLVQSTFLFLQYRIMDYSESLHN
jgi:hypothetical protein